VVFVLALVAAGGRIRELVHICRPAMGRATARLAKDRKGRKDV